VLYTKTIADWICAAFSCLKISIIKSYPAQCGGYVRRYSRDSGGKKIVGEWIRPSSLTKRKKFDSESSGERNWSRPRRGLNV